MMAPLVRFPSGPITPHGAYHVLHDRIPQMALRSYDDTVVFNMMGGLAIADKFLAPGRVELKDLKGLIAPWRKIEQKGASQDGVSFVDALYDPTDVQMDVRVVGKDPADCRRVARYLFNSISVDEQCELSFFDHYSGRWWAPLRWESPPPDSIMGIRSKTQTLSLRLQGDNAFWQSYPCVDDFVFDYAAAIDDFDVDDPDDLGTGWTVALSGSGTGGVHVEDGEVVSTMSGDRTMVARRNSYTSTGENQVAEIEIGKLGDWLHPIGSGIDLWVRMNNSGTPGTSGVRARIMRHQIRLSYFVGGVETLIRHRPLVVPPMPRGRWRLVAGDPDDADNARLFRVMRGAATIMTVKESGTGSPMGASNRSIGFGMYSTDDGANSPAARRFRAGENTIGDQSGFLEFVNVGDQDMWYDFTVFGPGTFRFWNGPNAGANEYVEFGPVLADQVFQIRTDPRKRGVVDMTVTPPSPQQQHFFKKALGQFLDFLSGNNAIPIFDEIKSKFGIVAPQGNPYSLLNGRWSRAAAIPPKPVGAAAPTYHVKVGITSGSADSKIIASGTPLRRYPL